VKSGLVLLIVRAATTPEQIKNRSDEPPTLFLLLSIWMIPPDEPPQSTFLLPDPWNAEHQVKRAQTI